MTNRLSTYWPETLPLVDAAVDGPAPCDDASEAARLLSFTAAFDAEVVNAAHPATLSFAEWAPRVRAERAARSRR